MGLRFTALASGSAGNAALVEGDGFGVWIDVGLGPRQLASGLADLGVWDDALADALADVELLAVEFNHDVAMQYASGRPRMLIDRVLGDDGHLSNAQAAELVRAVMARSAAGRLRHVVQLHLSRE